MSATMRRGWGLLLVMMAIGVGVACADLTPAGIPETNKSDAISLPEPKEISGKTRMVSVAATTKDEKAEVEWIVLNLNDESPVESLVNGKTLLVFPNDQDDMILILCYVRKSTDGASKPVRTAIKVTASNKKPPDKKVDPKPGPGPGPTPAPAPVPAPVATKVAHLSFVIDPARQTPEVATVVNDPALRAKLIGAGIRVHSLTVNSRSVTQGGLSVGVTRAGGAPCVILQDASGNILDAAKITDGNGVLALVGKFGG